MTEQVNTPDPDEYNEKEFTDGFNKGYFVAQVNPEIGKDLSEGIEHIDSFTSGLIFGAQEYFKERAQERMDQLGRLDDKNRNQDLDR